MSISNYDYSILTIPKKTNVKRDTYHFPGCIRARYDEGTLKQTMMNAFTCIAMELLLNGLFFQLIGLVHSW